MKMKLLAAVSALGLAFAAPVMASPVNLVTNGSFENGADGLAGWTIGGTDLQGYPPVAIFYGSATAYPTGAFGEAVPANNAPTNSPDAAGARAAYFVSDLAANQSLSQTITVTTAGMYQIGFSAYAPANGLANANNANFSGVIANVSLVNAMVSTALATTWQTFASTGLMLTPGSYLVEFAFTSFGFPAKDVVIDQVYVIAGDPPVGVPVPAALGLFGLGLLGLAAARRGNPALA